MCCCLLSSLCIRWDTVWGKLLCTVGVTGCVCVHCGLWINLLFMCGRLFKCCLHCCVYWCAERMFWMWLKWVMKDVQTLWKSMKILFIRNRPGLATDGDNLSLDVCIPTKPPTITGRSVLDMTQAHTQLDGAQCGHDRIKASSHTNGDSPTHRSEVSRPWASWDSWLRQNGVFLENFCVFCGVSNENHMQKKTSLPFGSCATTTFLTDQKQKQNNLKPWQNCRHNITCWEPHLNPLTLQNRHTSRYQLKVTAETNHWSKCSFNRSVG